MRQHIVLGTRDIVVRQEFMNYCCNIDWLSSYEMVSMLHVFL